MRMSSRFPAMSATLAAGCVDRALALQVIEHYDFELLGEVSPPGLSGIGTEILYFSDSDFDDLESPSSWMALVSNPFSPMSPA